MAKDTPTLELIQRTYHHNSTQGKNLARLVRQYEAKNNTMGIALVNQLLTIIRDKLPEGRKFSGVIAPKYVAHMDVPKGDRLGKATISGQALREGHGYKIVLYDRFEDVQATSAQLAGVGATKGVYDFLVGNEHKETLERILAANFEPRQLRGLRKGKDETSNKVASLREEFDNVFGEMGIDMGTYRRMLLLGPVKVGGDESVLRALADPHAFRSDLAWLAGNIGAMPESVQTAFFNYTSPVTKASRTDIPLLLAAIYQAKPEKALGIIGQFRDDALLIENLPDDHPVFEAVDKPDLDARFEPITLVKGTQVPNDDVSLRQKMGRQFITKSEALSLMRAVPVYQAREVFNKLAAQRYLGNNFPQLMAGAKAVMDVEAARYRQSKIDKEDFEPLTRKDEYKDVREADDFIAYAKGRLQESERDALCRLVPMTRAPRVFSNIYVVATKARLGKDQLDHYVPAADFGDDAKAKIERIMHTPVATSAETALPEEKQGVRKAGLFKGKHTMTVSHYNTLAAMLDNDEIVPAKLGKKDDTGKTLLNVMHDAVADAEPVDARTAERIAYIAALVRSPVGLGFKGIGVDGSCKTFPKHAFEIGRYSGAKFLFGDQKTAINRIYACIERVGLAGLDLETIASESPELKGKEVFIESTETGYLTMVKYQETLREEKGLAFNRHVPQAVSALTAVQDPQVFAGISRAQKAYRDDLKLLAQGKALASEGLLRRAQAMHDDYRTGRRPCEPLAALDDDNARLYGRCMSYEVHAVGKGADPKGEIIATFSKRRGDGLAGLAYNPDHKQWEGSFTHEELTMFLRCVARSNLTKQRDVHIMIDGGKHNPAPAPRPYYFPRSTNKNFRVW